LRNYTQYPRLVKSIALLPGYSDILLISDGHSPDLRIYGREIGIYDVFQPFLMPFFIKPDG